MEGLTERRIITVARWTARTFGTALLVLISGSDHPKKNKKPAKEKRRAS